MPRVGSGAWVSMPALPFFRICPPNMAIAETMPHVVLRPSLRKVMPLRPLSEQVMAWQSPSNTLPSKNRPSRENPRCRGS